MYAPVPMPAVAGLAAGGAATEANARRSRIPLRWRMVAGIAGILSVAVAAATWTSVATLRRAALRGAQAQAEAYGRALVLLARDFLGDTADVSRLKALAGDFRR